MMCVFIFGERERLRRRPNKKRIKWNENHCIACPLSRVFPTVRKAIYPSDFATSFHAISSSCDKNNGGDGNFAYARIERIYSVEKMLKTWIGNENFHFHHFWRKNFVFGVSVELNSFDGNSIKTDEISTYLWIRFAVLWFHLFLLPSFKRFNLISFFHTFFYLFQVQKPTLSLKNHHFQKWKQN